MTPGGERMNKTKELRMDVGGGQTLCFESVEGNPEGCSYVRILGENVLGETECELAYWDSKEWAEDPQGVMGAIMGCLFHGARNYQLKRLEKEPIEEECQYCGGSCPNEPNDEAYLCSGYAEDIEGLYKEGP